jgi:hypothetical protein
MQTLDLPIYRPGADLSFLGIKWLAPSFNFASSYNKAAKIFNDLPFSRNSLFLEMDKLVYLNNNDKWKKFRDFLLRELNWNVDEKKLDINKRSFTVLDIIKSLNDNQDRNVKLFILKEYSYYLSDEIFNFAENINDYCEIKAKICTLKLEEKEILNKYYSSAIEMTKVLLWVEVIKVNVELWLDLDSITENVEKQVQLVINQ